MCWENYRTCLFYMLLWFWICWLISRCALEAAVDTLLRPRTVTGCVWSVENDATHSPSEKLGSEVKKRSVFVASFTVVFNKDICNIQGNTPWVLRSVWGHSNLNLSEAIWVTCPRGRGEGEAARLIHSCISTQAPLYVGIHVKLSICFAETLLHNINKEVDCLEGSSLIWVSYLLLTCMFFSFLVSVWAWTSHTTSQPFNQAYLPLSGSKMRQALHNTQPKNIFGWASEHLDYAITYLPSDCLGCDQAGPVWHKHWKLA